MLKACAIRNVKYSDLWETPDTLWNSVLPKLYTKPIRIWEPFVGVTNRSTKIFKELGHDVIETTDDFFTLTWPETADVLISNPPFSRKFEVLEKLIQLQEYKTHPFMILLPSWVFASATVRTMVKKYKIELQIVVPPMRVHYYHPETHQQVRKTAFDSVFVGYGLPVKHALTYL